MRIQCRYRQFQLVARQYGQRETRNLMTKWMDWAGEGQRSFLLGGVTGGLELRMVDDNGNVVQPTPAFVPAYYERTSGPKPGGMTWCTEKPPAEHWVRRDDIKPTARA